MIFNFTSVGISILYPAKGLRARPSPTRTAEERKTVPSIIGFKSLVAEFIASNPKYPKPAIIKTLENIETPLRDA